MDNLHIFTLLKQMKDIKVKVRDLETKNLKVRKFSGLFYIES